MLGVVGSNLTIIKLEPTTPNMTQHGSQTYMQHVPPKNVAISCIDMLQSFGRGFIHDKLRHNIVKLKTSQSVREKLGSYCQKSIVCDLRLHSNLGMRRQCKVSWYIA